MFISHWGYNNIMIILYRHIIANFPDFMFICGDGMPQLCLGPPIPAPPPPTHKEPRFECKLCPPEWSLKNRLTPHCPMILKDQYYQYLIDKQIGPILPIQPWQINRTNITNTTFTTMQFALPPANSIHFSSNLHLLYLLVRFSLSIGVSSTSCFARLPQRLLLFCLHLHLVVTSR